MEAADLRLGVLQLLLFPLQIVRDAALGIVQEAVKVNLLPCNLFSLFSRAIMEPNVDKGKKN